MSNIKPDQISEHKNYNVKTTSNTPSQQAINNLFGHLFELYNKYIDKSDVLVSKEIPNVR